MYRESEAPPFIITAFNDHVVALDFSTGRRAWQVDLPVRRCIVEEERVLVASTDRVTALDYRSGERLWETECGVSPSHIVTLLVARSRIFASFGGEIAALDHDGKLLFRNGLEGTGYGAATLALPGLVAHADYN
jgi:outer membrane protein assembly factor BamB